MLKQPPLQPLGDRSTQLAGPRARHGRLARVAVAFFLLVSLSGLIIALVFGLPRRPQSATGQASSSPSVAGPTPTIASSAPVISPTNPPEATSPAVDDGLANVLENAHWVAFDGSRWIVGNFAGESSYVADVTAEGQVATSRNGGVVAWELTSAGYVFSLIDPDTGEVIRQYQATALDPGERVFDASIDHAGSSIWYAADSIGKIDIQTGDNTTVVAGPVEGGLGRVALFWSPSGATAASGLCDEERCRSYDVIDVASLTSSRISGPAQITALTDEYAVGRNFSGEGIQNWFLTNLASGEGHPVADQWIEGPTLAFALDDHRFIVGGKDGTGSGQAIVLIDVASGDETMLYEGPWEPLTAPELRAESLLSSQWVALPPGPLSRALFNSGSLSLPLLDIDAGTLDGRFAEVRLPSD